MTDPFYNPISQNPINDPIGSARRIQQQLDQHAAAYAAGQQTRALWTPAGTSAPRRDEAAEQRSRYQNDPQTPAVIAQLAKQLIETHPGLAQPIVVEVTTSSGWGLAEVRRAWPVGTMDFIYKDSVMKGAAFLTTDGKLIRPDTSKQPTTALTAKMTWTPPQAFAAGTSTCTGRVRQQLEADVERLKATPPTPAEPVALGPLRSRANIRRAYDLRSKTYPLQGQIRQITDLYGTRTSPRIQGPPSSGAKKAWRRVAKLQRRVARLNARALKLAGPGVLD